MKMINCQYGYVSPIELKVFSELDRELKQKQRRAKQHGAFNLHKKVYKKDGATTQTPPTLH